jgi:aspartyl-tRNA synthetase
MEEETPVIEEQQGQQAEGEENKKSKKQLNKEKKKAAKAAKKAEEAAQRAKEEEERQAQRAQEEEEQESSASNFGDLPVIVSSSMSDKVWVPVKELGADLEGQSVLIRARVQRKRMVGQGVFLLLREGVATVQAVAFKGGSISKAFIQYCSSIPSETVVDVRGTLVRASEEISSASITSFEISMEEVHAVTRASENIPFLVEDASRRTDEDGPQVNQDTRLDYRWIDARTRANQAIFRINSGVCMLFREFLLANDFVEIHSPKLIGGTSEGGSEVFRLDYFGRDACLAQSPQLYKQIAAACSGFGRVFEIGPVFRAENSNTHRHLCEFTGLDLEMVFHEHYYEVMDMIGRMFNFIFDGLNERFQAELEAVQSQYPFEPLRYCDPPLRLTFQEGLQILAEDADIHLDPNEDLSTADERTLGECVRQRYNTDFYMMDKYPLAVRPFYTMPCPHNPEHSNSYDMFIRGQEILSGAQRVHDPELLASRAEEHEIPVDTIQSYIDSFKHGAEPHAGGGIGLERVVMLFLGLNNIRKTSLFPRDPRRLFP